MPASLGPPDVIGDGNLRATLVGFAGALVVLAVLLWLVGIGDVIDALAQARPSVLVVVLAVASGWLTSWGLALRTVLGVLNAPIAMRTAVAVFAGALFANNVTPFGQAGGEPVSALLISRATKREYETGLAAIASVDALNFVPSIAMALVGLAYFATEITFSRNLEVAAVAVVALAVVVPLAAYLGWRNRYRVERIAVRALTPTIQAVGSAIPGRSPPGDDVLERRIEGFFGAVERVATSPRGLALALGFSAAGWLALSTSLWLSLFALGHTVSVAAVLVVVPAGAVAGVTPLPGGLGGVEAVLAGLLAPTAGIAFSTAAAAVLIHRGATYVLPTVLGGGVATVLADR